MRRTSHTRSVLLTSALFVVGFIAVAPWAQGGGPLLVSNGEAVGWSRTAVTGPAPLNSQTVDSQGRVVYHVDSGSLGPLTNAQAVALVDRIFGLYSGVSTSTLKFVNGGFIKDPSNGNTIDITSNNAGKVLSGNNPSYQNPIVFDSDGSITGSGGVLGYFTFLNFGNGGLEEGAVVLNGATVGNVGGPIPFGGVFTHEFGHFAGPLDHEQSNGNIAAGGSGSVLPPGFTRAAAYDLYGPFTETLFPFLYNGASGSALQGKGFNSSGFWVATLDADTINAFSNLYPVAGFRATDTGSTRGAIEGKVVIRTNGGDLPITGVNVVARRISQSPYPPASGTTAFPSNNVQLDSNGVPMTPPARAETDSVATVFSRVTGLEGGVGEYRFDGLPPGDYIIEIQQINPNALGGSSIGPLGTQIPLPVPEFYSGTSESGMTSDDPASFAPVHVAANAVTSGIDVVLNGFSSAALSQIDEVEPNDKKKKAQRIEIPGIVSGHANVDDTSKLTVDFGSQGTGPVHDLYSFALDRDTTIYISLDGTTPNGDLDMYLFSSALKGKVVSINSDVVLDSSTSPTTSEFIAVRLPAGRYYIGVSAFDGRLGYSLRFLTTSN